MVEPQKLSERLRDAVDFGPVKYGHSGYIKGLLTLVSEVEALESRLYEAQKLLDKENYYLYEGESPNPHKEAPPNEALFEVDKAHRWFRDELEAALWGAA